MTLTDLLGRDLRVEWHEAIALVRDVVERALEGAAETATVPDLHQVELTPWGRVEIHGGSVVADPVQRLGQMLQALLSRCDPPVQLRLLMAQPQESVRAYSEALAFFERPDRAPILQALYNRAAAALPLTDPDAFAAISGPAEEQVDAHVRTSHPRRRVVYAAGFLTLVAAVGAGALYARRAESSSPTAGPSDLTSKVSKVTAAVGSAVSAIGERVGLGPKAATDPAVPSDVAKSPEPDPRAPKAKTGGTRSSPGGSMLQRATLSAFDLDPSLKDQASDTDSAAISTPPDVLATPDSPGVPDEAVYSSDSAGVTAPLAVRPQLPRELPPGVKRESLTRIDLLILPDGTVESVKLVGQPRDVHAWMWLSAAKAWQFQPARKNGVPVRYKKTVWVAR